MDFSEPDPRPRAESIIPMINVVFLLLIFFLMTAQIAPPEPFEVEPPQASTEAPADAELILYIGPDGALGFREAAGEDAVLAELRTLVETACAGESCPEPPLLSIRADAEVPGAALAAILPKLAEAGFREAQIITALP
ncbi:MAG: biopolymer transporter ExbD [Pseudomonadota bacterium]